jgi:hypothetical protein
MSQSPRSLETGKKALSAIKWMYTYREHCTAHGEVSPKVRWHESGRHIGAYCPKCSRWIKWLPQTTEAVWMANSHRAVMEAEKQMDLFAEVRHG